MSSQVTVRKPSPSVVSAMLDEETVLLNVETGIYFGLDEIGSTIWSMLSLDDNEQEIVDHIAREYHAPHDQVAVDVRAFIDQLLVKGLLTESAVS